MSKRKAPKISRNQIIFRAMLGLVAASMVFSLIIVALPEPKPPITPTPLPTWGFEPTATAAPLPSKTPLDLAPPPPTSTAAEPAMGPLPPTATATVTPTVTPASAGWEFAVARDSRHNPVIYRRLLDAIVQSGNALPVHSGELVKRDMAARRPAFEELTGASLCPTGRPPAFYHHQRVTIQDEVTTQACPIDA